MIPHSAAFAAAIAGPHTVVTRVDVLSPTGQVLESGLPVADGSLACSASSDSRRRTDGMSVAADGLLGTLPALLRPQGTELRLWRGVAWPLPSPELLCLATLGIESVTVDQATGLVQVSGYDRLKRVARMRFSEPSTQVAPSLSVLNNIRILWGEVFPLFPDVIVDDDVDDIVLPGYPIWIKDRLDAIKSMCASLSAEPICEPMGNLRVSRIPDPQGTPTTPVYTPANVLDATVSQSRDQVYNGIEVTRQSATGNPIISDTIKDENPLSLTYWDVNGFGEVIGYVDDLDYVTTKDQANLAAEGQLRRTLGLKATVSFSTMPNPALSEGDIAPVRLPGSVDQHVIDSVTIGLGADDKVSANTRVATSMDVS